jgi:hypothetical protein
MIDLKEDKGNPSCFLAIQKLFQFIPTFFKYTTREVLEGNSSKFRMSLLDLIGIEI